MKRAFTALSICAAFALVGCVDREFDLAETSGEITLGGEELLLPMGEIEAVTLGDLLGENEGVSSNENGVYQISYSSFGDNPDKYEGLSIDGISIPNITGLAPTLDPITFSLSSLPSSLYMSSIEEKVNIAIPQLNDFVDIEPITMSQSISTGIPLTGQGSLTNTIINALGLSNFSTSSSDELVFSTKISLLKEINKIEWIEFGCDIHPYGTPFEITLDLNGVCDINGGGNLNFNIEFPEGYYLRDENGKDLPTATHNIFTKQMAIAEKQKSVTLLFYLYKIDYSKATTNENNEMIIDDHIKYNYTLDVNLCAGNYNLNSVPSLTIASAPKYKDVEVVISHFELDDIEYNLAYSFNGIPQSIDVSKIAFSNAPLTLCIKGLEWFNVLCRDTNTEFSPLLNITLPQCMHFKSNSRISTTNTLSATAQELANGVKLEIDYIDCKPEYGVTLENGALSINTQLKAALDMQNLDGHTVLASSLTPPASFNGDILISISDCNLELDAANSVVTIVDEQSFPFDLGDQLPTLSQTIDVPEMISSIERIEIGKANSKNEPLRLAFTINKSTTFPVNELEVDVAINIGKLLQPTQAMIDNNIVTQNGNGDYILVIKETWKPRSENLTKSIEFDALANIPAINNGKIAIEQTFPVTGSVKIKSGEQVDLSATSAAQIDIDIEIDDIEVRTFKGGVNFNLKPETMSVNLGDLSTLGVNINELSINPVLNVKLKENPTGIDFNADIEIKTLDASNNTLTTISVPTIPIAGSGASNIIISTPRNAAKYAKDGVTFIAVENLSQLLAKGIPSKISVDMSVASDKEKIYEIDLLAAKQGYNLEYQYEVLVPLEFDGEIDLSYESSITGLGAQFAELANSVNGLKVGDVSLLAEFGTTIPFNIVLTAELINEDGTTEGVAAKLDLKDCLINGYNPNTDGEKRNSNVEIGFDLGESHSLEGLQGVDGIRFKFTLYNTELESAALNKSQFVDGKLKLRVRDGLTVDVFELLKNAGN